LHLGMGSLAGVGGVPSSARGQEDRERWSAAFAGAIAAAALLPAAAMTVNLANANAKQHTSASHTQASPRWRRRLSKSLGHLAPVAARAETVRMMATAGEAAVATPISFEHVVKRPPPGVSAPAKISFAPEGEVTYLFSGEGGLRQELYALNPETGATHAVCEPPSGGAEEKDFSLEEKLRRERARELFTGITTYSWSESGSMMLIPIGKELYTQDGVGGKLRRLFDPAVLGGGPILDPRLSSDGSLVGFVYDSEVYIVPATGGEPKQVTSGARGTTMTHGLADFLAQEEMDRYEGFWISPDGSQVAFEEVDESHIPVYRIMHQGNDAVGQGAQEDHHYPFAGAANPKVRLGVAKTSGDNSGTTWFDLSVVFGPDFYLARVAWMPDGSLVAQVENRQQTALELVHLDLKTGAISTILREETDVWLNLHHCFTPLKKKQQFVWASERTGFQHLYLYDTNGKLIRQLTDGEWVVEDVKGIDEDAGLVYFVGNRGSWIDRHLFSVPLAGGEVRQLTQVPGMHGVVVDTKSGRFVDVRHSAQEPMRVELCNLKDGSILREIYRNEDPKIKELNLRPPEFFTLPSLDQKVTLQAAVWKPDESKFGPGPYPTAVSVYGGPHVQKCGNSWGTTVEMRAQLLRSRGYLVLSVDNRGSSRRGLAFEGAVKNDMGNLEVVDQVAGVRKCVEMGLADPARVGIYGWSYGGYMAAMALAKEPDVFRAAISGAPVTHWDGYDTHYTERYMGTPESNPDGYERSSVMAHLPQLRGHLLLVHGLLDENVHFRHTARLINALIRERKRYELLLFPDERHTPRGEKDRVYMEEQLFDFFERTLRAS